MSTITTKAEIPGRGPFQARPASTLLGQKQGLSASLPEVLGAIGISILILVGGGFGIAAGMNFSQDSKAQSFLDSVKSAEVLYQSKNDRFGDQDDLGGGDNPAITNEPDNFQILVSADGTEYCATIKSNGMLHTQYWLTAKSGAIVKTEPSATAAGVTCPTLSS